jgi:hypothetical protein
VLSLIKSIIIAVNKTKSIIIVVIKLITITTTTTILNLIEILTSFHSGD